MMIAPRALNSAKNRFSVLLSTFQIQRDRSTIVTICCEKSASFADTSCSMEKDESVLWNGADDVNKGNGKVYPEASVFHLVA